MDLSTEAAKCSDLLESEELPRQREGFQCQNQESQLNQGKLITEQPQEVFPITFFLYNSHSLFHFLHPSHLPLASSLYYSESLASYLTKKMQTSSQHLLCLLVFRCNLPVPASAHLLSLSSSQFLLQRGTICPFPRGLCVLPAGFELHFLLLS